MLKVYIEIMLAMFPTLVLCRHVQVNNDGAISFYEKFGFKIVERKENYYKRIEPADAFVLQKDLKETTTQVNMNGQIAKEKSSSQEREAS